MIAPSKFRLFLAGALLAVLGSCSDFPEIPYENRITSSSSYPYIEIGGQAWMIHNLNVPPGVCYDNQENNCKKYGKLYTLEAAKNACPSGWRLPSSAEWNALIEAAGNLVAGEYLRNTDGFAALYGGFGQGTEFELADKSGFWWDSDGNYHNIAFGYNDIQSEKEDTPNTLYSVRCVRDSK